MKDIGSRKQLFIDDAFFERTRNVALTMNPPAKMDVPAIVPDRPWEVGAIGRPSVVPVEGGYHLYYISSTGGISHMPEHPRGILCVAFSSDGIEWEKPELGLVEFNGSKANNILMPTGEDDFNEGIVFRDARPGIPDDETYKGIFRWLPEDPAAFGVTDQWPSEWIFKSPDGLQWTRMANQPSYSTSDTANIAFWDDRIGKYAIYMRYNAPPYFDPRPWQEETDRHGREVVIANALGLKGGSPDGKRQIAPDDGRSYIACAYRKVGRFETDDVTQWADRESWGGKPPWVPMSFDDQDPPGMDVECSGTTKYPWADDVYFMFPGMYLHDAVPPVGTIHNDGDGEVRLAVSRDGIDFRYLTRSPFVPAGAPGEFDSGMVKGIAPGMVRTDTRILQYYSAADNHHRHHSHVLKEAPGTTYRPMIGRLVSRLDGFVSVDAPYAGSEFTTVPVTFEGGELHLNVHTSLGGMTKVELLREGAPVKGHTFEEADPIVGNYIDQTVTWKGNPDVSSLAGYPVQMRFVMKDTKLYAFQFKGD